MFHPIVTHTFTHSFKLQKDYTMSSCQDLDEHLSASNKPSALVSMKLSETGIQRMAWGEAENDEMRTNCES